MLGYLGPNGTFSHQAAMEWSEGKEEIKEFSTGKIADSARRGR